MAETSYNPTALAPVARTREIQIGRALVPTTFGEALEYAAIFSRCSLLPKNCTTEDALVRILFGMELGLSVPQSLQNVAVVNGKAFVYGDVPLGLVLARKRDELETFEETWEPDKNKGTATCTVQRKGRKPVTRTFSIQDAMDTLVYVQDKNGGGSMRPLIEKGVWRAKAYQRRLCKFKARNESLRDTFPDVLLGIASEEDSDIPSLYADTIDGEVVRAEAVPVKTLDQMIDELPDSIRQEVVDAFDNLQFSRAERSVWLRRHPNNEALRKALRDEWMLRHSGGRKRAAGLRAVKRDEPAPAAEHAPEPVVDQAPEPVEHVPETAAAPVAVEPVDAPSADEIFGDQVF
jgi:hypothetical protein